MPTASKIAIIGAGSVGAAVSYALLIRQTASELLLVDVDKQRVEGEVADLSAGAFLSNTNVRVGTPAEAGQCDIIIITAGAKQREGETRVQLIDRNFAILKSVIGGMKPIKQSAILLLVANPVDILTYFAQKLSGLPSNQVFGSGTFLDTCRLRHAISQKVKIAETDINVFVLGEHGDSQFVAWSSGYIGNIPVSQFPSISNADTQKMIADETKNMAYSIIKAKGATYFGIAAVVCSICESITLDQKLIRPLSVYTDEYKVCISQPCVLGTFGVCQVLPAVLNDKERGLFQASAQNLRAIIEKYESQLA